MKTGTKSVLFGAHCFFIHPWFVAAAWIKLYGMTFDPRIWLAFFVHDLGYWGKPNMDGPEGETHVIFGANIMSVFGKRWADFSMYHSRYFAKKHGVKPSKLCFADKLAIAIEPAWLYLPRVNWSGEIHEYMKHADNGKYESQELSVLSQKEWFESVKKYVVSWVEEHKDGREDTWTPEVRKPINQEGVWQ